MEKEGVVKCGDSLTGLMISREVESILSGCAWQRTSGKLAIIGDHSLSVCPGNIQATEGHDE